MPPIPLKNWNVFWKTRWWGWTMKGQRSEKLKIIVRVWNWGNERERERARACLSDARGLRLRGLAMVECRRLHTLLPNILPLSTKPIAAPPLLLFRFMLAPSSCFLSALASSPPTSQWGNRATRPWCETFLVVVILNGSLGFVFMWMSKRKRNRQRAKRETKNTLWQRWERGKRESKRIFLFVRCLCLPRFKFPSQIFGDRKTILVAEKGPSSTNFFSRQISFNGD